MKHTFDLILRNGTCVSHRGIAPADIAVRKGRIEEFGSLSHDKARREIDATGLHIFPGIACLMNIIVTKCVLQRKTYKAIFCLGIIYFILNYIIIARTGHVMYFFINH